jgi:hypothetical protein
METLGGVAIGLASIYGGYRVIEAGAAPGQFVSFATAFLLAYEPAKRLAPRACGHLPAPAAQTPLEEARGRGLRAACRAAGFPL